MIKLDGYENFHNLKTDSNGRVICVCIRNDIKVLRIDQLSDYLFRESIWLDTKLNSQDLLLLGFITTALHHQMRTIIVSHSLCRMLET